jgi:hypothetical protein
MTKIVDETDGWPREGKGEFEREWLQGLLRTKQQQPGLGSIPASLSNKDNVSKGMANTLLYNKKKLKIK